MKNLLKLSEITLKDFLLANKAEVISMSIFEFDEELYKKSIREESFEAGL